MSRHFDNRFKTAVAEKVNDGISTFYRCPLCVVPKNKHGLDSEMLARGDNYCGRCGAKLEWRGRQRAKRIEED